MSIPPLDYDRLKREVEADRQWRRHNDRIETWMSKIYPQLDGKGLRYWKLRRAYGARLKAKVAA